MLFPSLRAVIQHCWWSSQRRAFQRLPLRARRSPSCTLPLVTVSLQAPSLEQLIGPALVLTTLTPLKTGQRCHRMAPPGLVCCLSVLRFRTPPTRCVTRRLHATGAQGLSALSLAPPTWITLQRVVRLVRCMGTVSLHSVQHLETTQMPCLPTNPPP